MTCGSVFSRYDGDGSGSIDESELLPAAKEMGFVVVEPPPCPPDGFGSIDESELLPAKEIGFVVVEEDLSKLVAEIDQDGNGEDGHEVVCRCLAR
ncbi:hypothetical protein T484DRAFT_1844021 [Baffinella frigidus]|nr:hypothetical protein T484DRAFT_1844021 [Cryptophyta sp. CCMP2293]